MKAFVIANTSHRVAEETLFFSLTDLGHWPQGNWQHAINEGLCFLRKQDADDFVKFRNATPRTYIDGFIMEFDYFPELV